MSNYEANVKIGLIRSDSEESLYTTSLSPLVVVTSSNNHNNNHHNNHHNKLNLLSPSVAAAITSPSSSSSSIKNNKKRIFTFLVIFCLIGLAVSFSRFNFFSPSPNGSASSSSSSEVTHTHIHLHIHNDTITHGSNTGSGNNNNNNNNNKGDNNKPNNSNNNNNKPNINEDKNKEEEQGSANENENENNDNGNEDNDENNKEFNKENTNEDNNDNNDNDKDNEDENGQGTENDGKNNNNNNNNNSNEDDDTFENGEVSDDENSTLSVPEPTEPAVTAAATPTSAAAEALPTETPTETPISSTPAESVTPTPTPTLTDETKNQESTTNSNTSPTSGLPDFSKRFRPTKACKAVSLGRLIVVNANALCTAKGHLDNGGCRLHMLCPNGMLVTYSAVHTDAPSGDVLVAVGQEASSVEFPRPQRHGQFITATIWESANFYPFQPSEYGRSRPAGKYDITLGYNPEVYDQHLTYSPYDVSKLWLPPLPVEEKTGFIAYFSSNTWIYNGRSDYVRQMMQTTFVDSFGSDVHTKDTPSQYIPYSFGDRFDKKIALCRTYKFVLAFENANEPHYITEKIYNAFESGAIPVYMGAPNIDDYWPIPHSFIKVTDFASPGALVEYLKLLDSNHTLYNEYFEWKKKPIPQTIIDLSKKSSHWNLCRLCTSWSEAFPELAKLKPDVDYDSIEISTPNQWG